MTIGSSHNHSADIAAALQNPASPPWAARFPNPPDLCFDYRRLLEQTAGIAHGGNPQHRICIIGAGVAGLVAARELLRCGFEQITLIEQSRRLGGRHLTVHVDGPQATASATPFEMGAMRMPFFNRTGEAPAQGRSLMAYYAGLYDLKISDFPNPGTPFVRSTGIYLRWEDDATKLAAFSDAELVDKCVRELDRILLRCSNVGSRISPFIDTTNARVQRWVTDRNALGCAKLYRAGAYQDAVGLMSYNRDYSARSGLYFAGESFSVDAGWTEPAMRGAVDAVINLCANQGAAFNGGFDLAHYPRYGVEL
jgi:monoamine oxidase